MAAHTTPGERGMMVAMGHGLCVSFWVSGEMTKNKVPWSISLYGRLAKISAKDGFW
jgi:hypothetical protein